MSLATKTIAKTLKWKKLMVKNPTEEKVSVYLQWSKVPTKSDKSIFSLNAERKVTIIQLHTINTK